jgi:hypothetical protein
MERIEKAKLDHPTGTRLGAMGCVVSCVVVATLAAAPAAQAAVPKAGAWESGSRSQPRATFDVRGPTRSRTVRRVSFPITCKGDPSAGGWGSTDVVRVRAGRRFTAYGLESTVSGRFTADDRAEVIVHSTGVGDCRDTRRYVVLHRGRRVAVRNGSYLALVGGGARMKLETESFGRMVLVDYVGGSIAAGCSDGSQRPLTLAGPERHVLAAPIRPSGRFDISAAAGSSIKIAGTFDGGSVAASVDLSVVLPDGMRCTAPQTLVGALAFPVESGGQSQTFPGPPVILQHAG